MDGEIPRVLHQTLEWIGSAERDNPLVRATTVHGNGTHFVVLGHCSAALPRQRSRPKLPGQESADAVCKQPLRAQLAGSLVSCLRHMKRATQADTIPCRLL